MMEFKKPKRIFEDSGIVDPASAYHIEMKDVVNTKGQDIKTMVDLGRYFSISLMANFMSAEFKSIG